MLPVGKEMTSDKFVRLRSFLSAIPFCALFLGIQSMMYCEARGTSVPTALNTSYVWVLELSAPNLRELYVTPTLASNYNLCVIAFVLGLLAWGAVSFIVRSWEKTAAHPEMAQRVMRVPADRIGSALVAASVCAAGAAFLTMLWIQANGSLAPDIGTGRTFGVNLHGMIYTWPRVGLSFYALIVLSAALAVAGFAAEWRMKVIAAITSFFRKF
jgi:hypothetical protein